jgi:hypothetical protein
VTQAQIEEKKTLVENETVYSFLIVFTTVSLFLQHHQMLTADPAKPARQLKE